ncbi:hypothetical protein TWF694_008018 [Orbilia ellipsospora]|uniref:Uncharacterized protein n=1 Tax=Orbilia ellipsospora TaxID=2528407 RepID=A0AAV9XEV0_9PEZI
MAQGDRKAISFSTIKKYMAENNELLMDLADVYEIMIDGNDYEYPIGAEDSGAARWDEVQMIENDHADSDDRSPAEIVYYDSLLTINSQLQRGIEILLERINGGYYDIEKIETRTEEAINQWSDPFAHQDLTIRKPIYPSNGMLIDPAPLIWYNQKESATRRLAQLGEMNRRIANLRVNALPGWYEANWEHRPSTHEPPENDSFWGFFIDFLLVGKTENSISSYLGKEWLPWAVMHWIYMIIEEQDRRLPEMLRWYDINGLAFNRQGVKQLYEILEPVVNEYYDIATKAFGPPIDKTNPDIVELWQMAKSQWRILIFYVQNLGRMGNVLDKLPQLTPNPSAKGEGLIGVRRTGRAQGPIE